MWKLIFIFVLFASPLSAKENKKLDSLLSSLTTLTDTNKVNCLKDIAWEYIPNEFSKAKMFGYQSLELANKLNYSNGKGNALYLLGIAYYTKDIIDSSMHYLELARKEYIIANNYEGQANALNGIGLVYSSMGEFQKAQKAYIKSVELHIQNNSDVKRLAISYDNLANSLMFQSKNEEALYYSQKALELREEYQDAKLGDSYLNIGIIYKNKGEYDTSIEYYLKALEKYEEAHDVLGVNKVYSNLGLLYCRLEDYDKALVFLNKALEYYLDHEKIINASRVYNNLGMVYKSMNNPSKSKQAYLEAVALKIKAGSTEQISSTYANIANIYCDEEDYRTAEKYCFKALAAAQKEDDSYGKSLAYRGFVQVYRGMNKPIEATQYAHKSYVEAKNSGRIELIDVVALLLSELYETQKDYENALFYHKEHKRFADSLMNKEKLLQISEVEVKFDIKLKDNELAQQSAEIVLKEKEISLLKGERLISEQKGKISDLRKLLLIITLVFVITLGTILYLFQRSKIAKNRKLHEKEQEVIQEKLRNEQIVKENLKQEVSSIATRLTDKDKILQELKLQLLELEGSQDQNVQFIHLFKIIETNIGSSEDWEEFKRHFNQLHKDFFNQLNVKFPDLSDAETRLAALLKLKFNSKEIANILSIELNSVKKSRSRLRKRLNVPEKQILDDFISEF